MNKKSRILFFDIETEPNLGYTWEKYEQNVLSFVKEWELLSVSWKWAGESTVFCTTKRGQKNDKVVAETIHHLFSIADVVIAHNGDEFDIKKSKARMVFHGLPPTKQLASVDTKKVAKRYFKFNGNGLSDLGKHFGLGDKQKHSGFDMWLGCMANRPESWAEMIKYNKQDVLLLEKIYVKMRPWMTNHPSMAKLQGIDGCPMCASQDVVKRGVRANKSTLSQQMFCKGCNGWYLTSYKKEVA